MQNIQVVMSTYNGEKYLLDQIESIMKQKNVNVFLAIRDDGSSDGTVKILKNIQENENITVHFGKNVGYKKSFLWLLNEYKHSSPYISFADQDDIWLPNKLEKAISMLEPSKSNKYSLYYSGLNVVDDELNEIGEKKLNDRRLTLGSSISRSNIPGCTMVFNQQLAEKVSLFGDDYDIAHDALVQLVCLSLNGTILYDDKSYILYRRHDSVVTNTGTGFVKMIIAELNNASNKKNSKIKYARAILQTLKDEIPQDRKKLLKTISNYKTNKKYWFSLLKLTEIKTGNKIIDLYTFFSVLLRKY
ncbi:glycosyltransferase [Aerococcus sp. L_32]|uniref:glycosyltransferase n=1 Tax=Aerococcus sp. L_32 TaxID=3422316 RepID=UPI003D6B921A